MHALNTGLVDLEYGRGLGGGEIPTGAGQRRGCSDVGDRAIGQYVLPGGRLDTLSLLQPLY